MLSLTRRDFEKAHSMIRRQQRDAERTQARRETYMGQVTQSLEIGAGALASGVLAGRFESMALFGIIPMDLLVGLGLHGLGFTNVMGRYADDVHNVADGVLAGYLVKLGAGLGTSWRIQAGLSPFAVTSGNLPGYAPNYMPPAAYADPNMMNPAAPAYAPAYAGGGLTEQDLAAMAAMA